MIYLWFKNGYGTGTGTSTATGRGETNLKLPKRCQADRQQVQVPYLIATPMIVKHAAKEKHRDIVVLSRCFSLVACCCWRMRRCSRVLATA
jgi:hypothetical protein